MTLTTYADLEQGSPEWLEARCGLLTASTIGGLITQKSRDALTVACPKCEAPSFSPCISAARKTPTPIKTVHDERSSVVTGMPRVLEVADNETSRGLTETLMAERLTGHVDFVYPTADMQRGTLDEPLARNFYAEHHAPVVELGFAVRDFGGHKLGASPDGLVGDSGGIEIKSRRPKTHIRTWLTNTVPSENMAQIQTLLMVFEREWWDYCSYAGGYPMYVKRVYPDQKWQSAIRAALAKFEEDAARMIDAYRAATLGEPVAPRVDHFAEVEIGL